MPCVDVFIELVDQPLLDIQALDSVTLHLLGHLNDILYLRLKTGQNCAVSKVSSWPVHDIVIGEPRCTHAEVTLGHFRPSIPNLAAVTPDKLEVWRPSQVVTGCAYYHVNVVTDTVGHFQPRLCHALHITEYALNVGLNESLEVPISRS